MTEPDDRPDAVSLQAEVDRLRMELAAVRVQAREEISELLVAGQHRARSSLAVVRAILSRPAQPGTHVEDYSAHLLGRVDTLIRLYGALTRSATGTIDLEEMVRDEFVAQGGLNGSHVVIGGPSVALPGKAAEVLGLAIHELAANSIKFGALADGAGRLEIGWRLGEGAEAARLSIRWSETGVPTVSMEGRRGFGRELIEDGLPYQLGAETSFDLHRDGFICSIVLSVDRSASTSWSVLAGRPGPEWGA